jgi:NAD(P)-dependent dehydrogenase (short-subunit alcohol dehydrogenase family)
MDRAHQLEGRRILVTGAASGMGYAIAELFAAQGARLGLIDRNEAGLKKIAEATGQLALPCDLAAESSVIEAIGRAERSFGGLDGIVNAAGILREQSFAETTTAIFDELMGINLRGAFLMSRHALPAPLKASRATIVNIASNAALNPHPGLAVYSASKAALVALTEAMAKEFQTIRVNVICPGIIDTPMTAPMFGQGGIGEAAVQATIALKRPGRPSEVAEAALFLTSDASSFVSAATMRVNGGALY